MDSNEIFIKDIPAFFRRFKGSTKDGQYDLYCQEFAYSIIYGNLNSSHVDEILQLIGLSCLPDRLLLVQTDYNVVFQFYPEFNQFPRRFNQTQTLQRCVKRSGIEGLVASYPARGVVGVFLCTGQESSSEEKVITEKIRELAKDMIVRVNEEVGESVAIGISRYCSSLSRFPQAYAECKEGLFHCFRLGKNHMVFHKDICEPRTPFSRDVLKTFGAEIVSGITNGERAAVKDHVDEMIKYMLSVAMSPINIRLILVSFVDTLRERFYNSRIPADILEKAYLNTSKQVINGMFADDIKETMEQFCDMLIKELGAESQSSEELLFHKIDEAIEKYYPNSEFNLDVMANLFHYSSYHFGRLFKNTRGESFRQYLARYRIERAKEFLARGDKPNEVAFQTGFNSISYFCTVFKNLTGVSPKQYQENFIK